MRVLTGIKPTGDIHLGNYIGAILPIIELSKKADEVLLFVADYHALNNKIDSNILKNNNKEMMLVLYSFLGHLDNVYIYFQSQIPEIFEIQVILTNFTPKGLLNRAHAYKAKVDSNILAQKEPDFEVNIGLFNYPILMSSDILTFSPDFVPVGFDQKQHLEITRDIAKIFNKQYGNIFILPEPYINNENSLLGLDGRKMSKSYNNTIALFIEEEEIFKKFKKVKSDSTQIGEAIDYTHDTLYNIMSSLFSSDELSELRSMYNNGDKRINIKQTAFDLFISHFKPYRDRYNDYSDNYELLLEQIKKDRQYVRNIAKSNLKNIKEIIGINI